MRGVFGFDDDRDEESERGGREGRRGKKSKLVTKVFSLPVYDVVEDGRSRARGCRCDRGDGVASSGSSELGILRCSST